MAQPFSEPMIMADGSICFYSEIIDLHPRSLYELIGTIRGVQLIGEPLCDAIDECWLDFSFCGELFTVHNPYAMGDFWFFCSNPNCKPIILSYFVDELTARLPV